MTMGNFFGKLERLADAGGVTKNIAFLIVSAVAMGMSIFGFGDFLPFDVAWIAVVLCGFPIALEALFALLSRFDITADLLVSIAMVASIFIGDVFEAAEVALIMQFGELLEELTIMYTRNEIAKRMHAKEGAKQTTEHIDKIAESGKAQIINLADKWATVMVVIALATSLLTWLFTGELLRAVTVLVVFCPCAFVLATPTAVAAASGNAARHGFLVKNGDALEKLALAAKQEDAGGEHAQKINKNTDAGTEQVVSKTTTLSHIKEAGIVHVNDDAENTAYLYALARHMMTVIKTNMAFSLALNFCGVVLSVAGFLNPVVGAVVHNSGSVIVIINSALLLHWKGKIRS